MANPLIIDGIGKALGGLFGLIDKMHTSDAERLELKQQLLGIQTTLLAQALDYERGVLEAKANIIIAEAKGESWLQRSWRPITMLGFLALVAGYWFGLTPPMSEDAINGMFLLLQIGLGGYVVGRSAEKVAKNLSGKGLLDTEKE